MKCSGQVAAQTPRCGWGPLCKGEQCGVSSWVGELPFPWLVNLTAMGTTSLRCWAGPAAVVGSPPGTAHASDLVRLCISSLESLSLL